MQSSTVMVGSAVRSGEEAARGAILGPGHRSDRRQPEPGKIRRKGGCRPSRVHHV